MNYYFGDAEESPGLSGCICSVLALASWKHSFTPEFLDWEGLHLI